MDNAINLIIIFIFLVNPINQVNEINLAGNWAEKDIQIVREAIFYTALKISPLEFKDVFGGTTIIWGNREISKMCKVKGIFACVTSDKKINIFRLCTTRRKSIKLVLHELGHIFGKRLDELPYKAVPDSISLSKGETFADMFAGWVMNDLEGIKKEWMDKNMPRFLNYVLTRRMDNTLDKNLGTVYAYY